jgi:hypothetical protein
MQGCTSLNEKKVTRNLTRHKIYARCRLNGRVLCCAPHYSRPIGYYPITRIQTKETPRPTPPTHQTQARICNKSNKIKPQATHGKRYPKLDPVSGKWLLQPAAAVNLLDTTDIHVNPSATPTPTSTSPNCGLQPRNVFLFRATARGRKQRDEPWIPHPVSNDW